MPFSLIIFTFFHKSAMVMVSRKSSMDFPLSSIFYFILDAIFFHFDFKTADEGMSSVFFYFTACSFLLCFFFLWKKLFSLKTYIFLSKRICVHFALCAVMNAANMIQLSAITSQSNMTWYCIKHCIYWGRIWVRSLNPQNTPHTSP